MLPDPFSLVFRDTLDSTNDEARRQSAAGAGHGTVVMAARQDAGRGRRGRAWASLPGNLHCSLLLDPGPERNLAPQLAFVAALGLWDALAELLPAASFRLKWPNDVLCGGRKIAGMLLEWAEPMVILGVGVNIAQAPAQFPATCLKTQGSEAAPADVLASFCAKLPPWYQTWREQGFVPIRQAWLARCSGIGEAVTARLADDSVLEGRFNGLDVDGALLLETAQGTIRRVLAGEVYF
jgi:BirA family biotin operon repressor/biotin-[acetyl-CoA-carboxylase] ligase